MYHMNSFIQNGSCLNLITILGIVLLLSEAEMPSEKRRIQERERQLKEAAKRNTSRVVMCSEISVVKSGCLTSSCCP